MSAEPPFPDLPTGVEVDVVHPRRSLEVERARTLVRRVAEGETREIGYLSIVLADHETVTRLNREYLGHDYETDVLSFPLGAERSGEPGAQDGFPPIRGEIYVDLDTAAERAPEFDTSFEHEAARYLVHGLLHLAGYDDESDEGRRRMRELENRYLDEEDS